MAALDEARAVFDRDAWADAFARLRAIDERTPLAPDDLDRLAAADVANIVWCTGFDPEFSWIDLPIFDAGGKLRHTGGVVAELPGLYFVGLRLLYSFSSEMIHGVGRDAERIATLVAARPAPRSAAVVTRETAA